MVKRFLLKLFLYRVLKESLKISAKHTSFILAQSVIPHEQGLVAFLFITIELLLILELLYKWLELYSAALPLINPFHHIDETNLKLYLFE